MYELEHCHVSILSIQWQTRKTIYVLRYVMSIEVENWCMHSQFLGEAFLNTYIVKQRSFYFDAGILNYPKPVSQHLIDNYLLASSLSVQSLSVVR